MGTQGGGIGVATTTPKYALGTTEIISGGTGATAMNATNGSGPQQTPPIPPNMNMGIAAANAPPTTPTTARATATATG